jgi:hypothetical protein
MEFAQKVANAHIVGTLGNDDFDTIARGKDDRFVHLMLPNQRGQRAGKSFVSEREPFPDLDRRRFVTNSYQCELHR